MKTGNKIVWVYTWLIMGLVVFVVVLFYILTARSINKVYESYLAERAIATAEKYWERDELDDASYDLVQKRYDQALPIAKELILNADSIIKARKSLSRYLSDEDINELYSKHIVHFEGKEHQYGVAIYYPDNEGNFIVLIRSNNQYGADIIARMGWLLLAAFGLTAVLVYGVGKLYAGRLVNQIDEAYQNEKSFISNASHELNNPLTAIQGECEITLLRERTPAEYASALERIKSESQRMIILMKHLLFLSRGDKEIINSAIEPIHLQDFLQTLVTDPVRFKKEGPEVIVEANPHLLGIAVQNIINNAYKYSKGKEVEIRTKGYNVYIEDQGIGISSDDIKRIFQPFYRGKNARGFEGQGIGLTLSVRILKSFGARVKINSELNKGTQVHICFQPSSISTQRSK